MFLLRLSSRSICQPLTLVKTFLAGIFKAKKERLAKLLKMQEIVIQGKRLNYSQTNALALTDVHFGLMDMCGMRFRKVNRCPNKSLKVMGTKSSRCLQSYIAPVDKDCVYCEVYKFCYIASSSLGQDVRMHAFLLREMLTVQSLFS